MLNKSEIIGGTLSIIAVFALLTGIYNIVIYQNVSNNLATGNLDNITDITNATKTADTSTDTTTAAVTSTSTTTAAITTTPVSTDVITTNQQEECRRTLPFGPSAGDEVELSEDSHVAFNSCVMLDQTVEQPLISPQTQEGYLNFGNDYTVVSIYGIHSENYYEDWTIYHRPVSSDKEKKAISCLVNNSNTAEAYVYTWNKTNTQKNEQEQVIQVIVASLGQSATYIIRIYSDSLPTTDMAYEVAITYKDPDTAIDQTFMDKLTVDDVRGKRQIFDITHAAKEEENLTVVEEGKNCRIFC